MIELGARTAALVLIDLQNGIVGLPLQPRSGKEVAERGIVLARTFRAAGAMVILVNVEWASDFADAPGSLVDTPSPRPSGGLPPAWSMLVDGLAEPGDLRIVKRQWGAFHGTELDLQLRRRGVTTIALAGIATNFGVESTARQAWEHGYNVVLLEDACASVSADLHNMAISSVLPRIARVTQSSQILFAGA